MTETNNRPTLPPEIGTSTLMSNCFLASMREEVLERIRLARQAEHRARERTRNRRRRRRSGIVTC